MLKPILFVVAHEATVLDELERDLNRRFGRDTEVVIHSEPAQAKRELSEFSRRGEEVALLIVDHGLPGGGIEFLQEAHRLHPRAKRVLLVERSYRQSNPIVPAMAFGQIDYHLVKPWHRDLGLYPPISEFLAAWSASRDVPYDMLQIVGMEREAGAHLIRDVLTRMSIPFSFHSYVSETGQQILKDYGLTEADLPIALRQDGKLLIKPNTGDLVEAIGGNTQTDIDDCDLAIIGAGPAGLAAAVYGASEGLETMVLEKNVSGGQVGSSANIRNFLGFTWGISGHDFAYRACEQAWLFGAHLSFIQEANKLEERDGCKMLFTVEGSQVKAKAVILSMGVTWRMLQIPTLEALLGRGVFYGAAESEASALADQRVAIVGAGNSAGQAALHLAKYASQVTILVRGEGLTESMSEYLIREIEAMPNIEVRTNVEVVEGCGEDRLEGVVVRDRDSGATQTIAVEGLFVMIGAEPKTAWLEGVLARDAFGYILTGQDLMRESPESWPLERAPFMLETSIPGVFCAGDVRHRSIKRVASAVGEGATAVHMVHEYLATLQVELPLGVEAAGG